MLCFLLIFFLFLFSTLFFKWDSILFSRHMAASHISQGIKSFFSRVFPRLYFSIWLVRMRSRTRFLDNMWCWLITNPGPLITISKHFEHTWGTVGFTGWVLLIQKLHKWGGCICKCKRSYALEFCVYSMAFESLYHAL